MIAANPAYSSLNLSQAVQIVCYCLRLVFESTLGQTSEAEGGSEAESNDLQSHASPKPVSSSQRNANLHPQANLASIQAVQQLQAHWVAAMQKVDFINPDKPQKAIQRLARLLSRSALRMIFSTNE